MRRIKQIDPNFDIHELANHVYDIMAKHGGMSDDVGNVGSWGDTLTDEEVCFYIEEGVRNES